MTFNNFVRILEDQRFLRMSRSSFRTDVTETYLIAREREESESRMHLECSESRLRLKRDGTRAETTSCLSAKWTSPFKS